ncbi:MULTISPECIES: heparin lyase I family protein [unclassified Pseudomonas]|uniref:heparin lyase I family protein n=1 Tax=unclassified Pseudomonas TaxID=196821 RepID=UPI00384D943E
MTPINSLIRTTPLDVSSTQHFPDSRSQQEQGISARSGNTPVSFMSQPQNAQVNFGGANNALQQPQSNFSANGGQADPLTQLMTLIQDLLQRLQALMQGNSGSVNTPSNNAVTGGGKVGGNSGHNPVDNHASTQGTPQAGKGGSSPANGQFSEHSLGNQLSVQKSPEDKIGMAKDPERGDVIKVDFNKGHYTEHSTSPRAEIKDGTKLQEGEPYSFKFGMKREANNDGTFFQVLDHNNAKPSPRAWLATKDGQYQLHLKTSEDSNAPSKVFNIGKPGDAAKDVGKWADFQIDFKRGIGDGEISVTKNGENVFDKKGISTMFDTHSSDSYAKFGQYRNEGDHSPATSLFSGFSVAKGS